MRITIVRSAEYLLRIRDNQGEYLIECPRCKNDVLVYPWSFHNGKKCPHCTIVFRPCNIKNFYVHDKENYISIEDDYKFRGKKLPPDLV